ncbi:MAG: tRNA uridine-5-carboxymethylaminomethyl(34) synthesis GTPase MnmE [Desulfovibrio sp.]
MNASWSHEAFASRRKDTIAAIATPPGAGGVAVLRISGPQARTLGLGLFHSSQPGFRDFTPRLLHFGTIRTAQGRVVDEVLTAYMPGPHSYTGEDVLEIHCHGGDAAPAAILDLLLEHGARMAERGEFTLRAFLAGRLDLTQAEAVAELIAAPGRAALHLAQAKLAGGLGRRVHDLRTQLERLRAQLCLAVDFPEEDVDCLPPKELLQEVASVRQGVQGLLAGMERARAWREGVMVVLAGRVNTGKSSLLNALLGRERAIVTDRPGTTRDYIEEHLLLDGLRVRIVDTAGLRDQVEAESTDRPVDEVEAAGMEISRDLAARAELVLFVVDGSRPLNPAEQESAATLAPGRTLVVVNKQDQPPATPHPTQTLHPLGLELLDVSARTGHGLDRLATRIRERCLCGAAEPDPDEAVPNARQAALLREADRELEALAEDTQQAVPYDLLGVRLEGACNTLASLTGEIAPQDVLHSIFDNFCIGK